MGLVDFLKKGIEFNKLAQSFNAMYLALNELTPKLERNLKDLDSFKEKHIESVLMLAYIAKKGIIDRLDNYQWGLEAKISIPSISSSRVTVGYAWSLTVSKLTIMSTILYMSDDIQEIYDGGDMYIYFEKNIPEKLKNW